MRRLLFLAVSLIPVLLMTCPAIQPPPVRAAEAQTAMKTFSLFSVLLPGGWSGEEDFGFHGGSDKEYRLVLLKKGESAVDAQVTVFLLPNERKETAESFARQMAELQDNVSPVAEEDGFQAFNGEMRSKITRGMCRTRVRATEDRILIIVVNDPGGVGAEAVFASLRGVTPEVIDLLGRRTEAAPSSAGGTPAGGQQ